METGGQFGLAYGGGVVVLDTGATANLACSTWLNNRNSYLHKMGFPKVNPYPTLPRLKFGAGRIGVAEYAADIKVGSKGRRGAITAFVLDMDIPALLRKGAIEAHGRQVDSERNI